MISKKSYKNRGQLLLHIVLCCLLIIVLFPTICVVMGSLKGPDEILVFDRFFPQNPTLNNFQEILDRSDEIPIFRWFFNSIFVSVITSFLVVFLSSMAAYPLARLPLPGKKIIFAAILATMMVPGQVTLVPVYLILEFFNLPDTYWALIIPHLAGAFGVFMFRQFFMGIPLELEDAARVDGCNRFRTYLTIILPISKPALATLGILTFMANWNAFLFPLIVTDSVDMRLLPVGLALFFQGAFSVEYGMVMAAAIISTFPALVMFIVFQKYIIEGLTLGAVKE